MQKQKQKGYGLRKRRKRIAVSSAASIVLVIAALWYHWYAPKKMEYADFDMGSVQHVTVWLTAGDLRKYGAAAILPFSCEQEVRERPLPEELEQLAVDSGGAFNPYMGALVKLWNIDSTDGSPPRVPAQAEIEAALAVRALDPGAYGKGMACDLFLEKHTKEHLEGYIYNLGGNILVFGKKPWRQPFKVALRDPKGAQNDILGVFSLPRTNTVATSGSYEKYFEQDGKRYHHIFDPQTGYPAQRDPGLISVTVLSGGGALGDALSTACFVLGYKAALPLLARYNCDALFIYENGAVRSAGQARRYFKLQSPAYHWEEIT
ncbi:MAG: FAD:protein FMN transferase [Oscillospiraceae bacterium]|jgi:thiamine biosynthesis lipoprotein|nr:FAD:protein FMN transferase [Oscillospiraceae bacterium]